MDHSNHNTPTHRKREAHDKHEGHSPDMFKRRFIVSLVLTAPVLIFTPAVQGWLKYAIDFPGSIYIPAILGLVIFVYGGLVFLRGAKRELANKQPGMMTLVAMAISVAFGYSLAVSVGIVNGMDFWWELATLVTIMLLGHWLEMASVQNAQGALGELAKLLPDTAEVIHDDTIMTMPVGDLKVGDAILIRPGAQVPIDGTVTKGKSDINESMLTGESKPVMKTVGDMVIGGTINGTGALTVTVAKVGNDTALAGIMKLVAEAQSSKSGTQILADKAAGYLTYLAIIAALLTWIGWWVAGANASFILERVVTVLVVACPHALGLAVPLVTAISTTLAAKNGILVRQRMALEAARNIDVVLFDKTGTLTKGEQGVVGFISNDKHATIDIAYALEAESEHPIARAITSHVAENGAKRPRAENFTTLSGRGVKATIENETYYAGGPNLLSQLGIVPTDEYADAVNSAERDGKTMVYVTDEQHILGAFLLADVIRDESKSAVVSLKQSGKRVAMLTGDSKGVAQWVAGELGITEYFAEVLPENKADTVTQLQKDKSMVAMVGDGINDAPAITQADIGIAIGAGTDVAIESAGIVLASSDPRGVAKTIKLSTYTYRKMLQNLAWATGYNAIAIPLAAGVASGIGLVLSPAVGAILMSLSTIIVAINAQLLRRIPLT